MNEGIKRRKRRRYLLVDCILCLAYVQFRCARCKVNEREQEKEGKVEVLEHSEIRLRVQILSFFLPAAQTYLVASFVFLVFVFSSIDR